MELYIVDTIAFLGFLADNLPSKANEIFKKAEKKQIRLLLPSIALGETLFYIYKSKERAKNSILLEKLELIFQVLEDKEIIELTNLDIQAWHTFSGLNISDLHARMIVISYYYHQATAILTNNKEIGGIAPIVWE